MGTPTDISISGNTAFVSSSSFGLSVANVQSPGAVSVLGAAQPGFLGTHVATGGNIAVVTGTLANTAHAWVVDQSLPSAPVVIGEVTTTLAAAAFFEVAVNATRRRMLVA